MSNRVLLVLVSILILGLASCQSPPEAAQPEEAAAPPPDPDPVYEITTDDITSHENWTSRNISVLGLKLGERTRNAESNLGELANTRTTPEDYITAYRDGGIVIHTFRNDGRARRIEITQLLNDIGDERLARLLSSGNLDLMREVLGSEERVEQNAEDNSTEYVYDSRGIRFVQYTVSGRTVNAIRFSELRS